MDSNLSSPGVRDEVLRTRALSRAVAAVFSERPDLGSLWLHGPHPLLLGASPAEAFWYSERLARYAAVLPERDTHLERAWGGVEAITELSIAAFLKSGDFV